MNAISVFHCPKETALRQDVFIIRFWIRNAAAIISEEPCRSFRILPMKSNAACWVWLRTQALKTLRMSLLLKSAVLSAILKVCRFWKLCASFVPNLAGTIAWISIWLWFLTFAPPANIRRNRPSTAWKSFFPLGYSLILFFAAVRKQSRQNWSARFPFSAMLKKERFFLLLTSKMFMKFL